MSGMPKAPASGGSVGSLSAMKNRNNPTMMMPMMRSESLAYPKPSPMSRAQYFARQHAQKVLATLAFIVFVLFVSSDFVHDSNSELGVVHLRGRSNRGNFGGAYYPGYFKVADSIADPNTFRFAAVTDLDELSRVKDSKKPTWQSYMLMGTIKRSSDNKYAIEFEPLMRTLQTKHNEAGRGAEFSELTIYDDRLLTFDDRTGDVFEILNNPEGTDSFVVPRFVITEGSGDTDKGMKWEWATVKDDLLYMGSMGKEYTRDDGSIANTNNLWIATLDTDGVLTRIDWTKQYTFVRTALGAAAPGYVIHEAVNWSPHLNKWVFLPRRVSADAYNENKDEKMGSNKLVLVDKDFTTSQVVEIAMADKDGLHGFSSFAFIPNSKDRHALALRSVEENCVGGDDNTCKQRSYFVIFDVLTGEVLMDEVKQINEMKFEGIEFVDVHVKAPQH